MQGGKYRIHGAYVLFLVGAAFAAAVAEEPHGGDGHLLTSSKLLRDMSSRGDGGGSLLDSLGIAKKNSIVDAALRFPRPKDYIQSGIRISLDQYKIAMNNIAEMIKDTDDSLNRQAVEDCQELMNYAIDELQESMSSVGECPLQYLSRTIVDLKNWLSAVLSYADTCMDGFTKPGLRSTINKFLRTSIRQTGQALNVVSVIPEILHGLHNHGGGGSHSGLIGRNRNPSVSAGGNGGVSGGLNPSVSSGLDGRGGGKVSSLPAGVGDASVSAGAGDVTVSTSSDVGGNENPSVSAGGAIGAGGTGLAVDHPHKRFPAWMSNADRKLLMSRQGAGSGGGGGSESGNGIQNGSGGGVRQNGNCGNRSQNGRSGGGGASMQPNAVVAKDGSGQYKTITDAINAYKPNPQENNGTRHVIYVKAGVYDEYVVIAKKQTNIFMYGDGPEKTIVTGAKCNRDGVSTFRTAPFAVVGKGFICKSMGFRNTAGPEGHQAVALRVQSDMSAFYNCRMDGYQDTLYTHAHRQFYSNCVISGTVDFIFGDAAVIIQDSTIIVRMPMENQKNIVTAHGRTQVSESTGLVIQNCQIVAEDALLSKKTDIESFLGRPWKPYARTVVMESTIGDFIKPEGWMPWAGNIGLDTCDYMEYANRGPGANTSSRVNWKGYHVISNANEAKKYTVESFIEGNQWLPATGAPFFLGLKSA